MSYFDDDWWRPPSPVLTPAEERDTWSLQRYSDWLDPQMDDLWYQMKELEHDQQIDDFDKARMPGFEYEERKEKRKAEMDKLSNKMGKLSHDFGYYLFKKWFDRKYQPLGYNTSLELWTHWAENYDLRTDAFEYTWYHIFI